MKLTGLGYDERENISLGDAIEWAQGLHYPVTLYLYHPGDGIRPVTPVAASVPAIDLFKLRQRLCLGSGEDSDAAVASTDMTS